MQLFFLIIAGADGVLPVPPGEPEAGIFVCTYFIDTALRFLNILQTRLCRRRADLRRREPASGLASRAPD